MHHRQTSPQNMIESVDMKAVWYWLVSKVQRTVILVELCVEGKNKVQSLPAAHAGRHRDIIVYTPLTS